MEYILISFKSRSETLKFAELLKKSGVYATVVTTPKEAGIGCGLSVKTENVNLGFIKRAIYYSGSKSFAAVFLVKVQGLKRQIKPLYM